MKIDPATPFIVLWYLGIIVLVVAIPLAIYLVVCGYVSLTKMIVGAILVIIWEVAENYHLKKKFNKH